MKLRQFFFDTSYLYSTKSSIVREIISFNGDISNFVPEDILNDIITTYQNIYNT